MIRYAGERGYVLHARAWRETSLLVEVLSEHHGRVGLVARGVHGPRKQSLRAALQPLQHIRFEAVQRGELAWLNAVEALDVAARLPRDAALAGFYVSELVMRLAPREDPHAHLYSLYGKVRERLGIGAPLAWTLRRFERDLLAALGVGFDYSSDGDGEAIDPAARYRLEPEHGPRRVAIERDGDRDRHASGRALLALAADRDGPPPTEDLSGLRRALREVLAVHLGGRGLKSWEMMGDLARMSVPAAQADDSVS
jgi:DNA repair protein RecO (recombination protein O)